MLTDVADLSTQIVEMLRRKAWPILQLFTGGARVHRCASFAEEFSEACEGTRVLFLSFNYIVG